MAAVTKVMNFDPASHIGSYLVGRKPSASEPFVAEPVFQLDPDFLDGLSFPFVTTMAYPVGDLVVLGSVTYPGIMICTKNNTDNGGGSAPADDNTPAMSPATVEELLSHLEDDRSLYNKGNALARQGKYPEAIAAYDEVLKSNPGHEDANLINEFNTFSAISYSSINLNTLPS